MNRIARRLIVVDLENLLGCSPEVASDSCWERALAGALEAVEYRAESDHLVIGVGPDWVFTAAALAPQARLVTRAGRDGADDVLCEWLEDVDDVVARYRDVVIASGDHAFIRPMRRLAAVGRPAILAALPSQAAMGIDYFADQVLWLERPANVLGDAAYVSIADGMRRVATARHRGADALALAA
ncbi:hypothetical protein [Demequina pelophila]|uniref:hypothetical protein n=1 Tax=Demequina pelophila TaxID=1638984 RepID=UPI0007854155|nr:hypothetical protein [Demequina pelophila]